MSSSRKHAALRAAAILTPLLAYLFIALPSWAQNPKEKERISEHRRQTLAKIDRLLGRPGVNKPKPRAYKVAINHPTSEDAQFDKSQLDFSNDLTPPLTARAQTRYSLKAKTNQPPAFSASLWVARSTALKTGEDGKTYSANGFGGSLKLNPGETVGGFVTLNCAQDLNHSESSGCKDLFPVALYRGFSNEGWLYVKPGLSFTIPVSKTSRETKEMKYGVGPYLGVAVNPKYLWNPDVHINTSVNFKQNFYNDEVDRNGDSVGKYSSLQYFFVSYDPKKWFVSFEFNHFNTSTYDGELTESYEHCKEIGWKFMDHASVGFGHDVGGPAVNGSGGSNYDLYKGSHSTFYVLFSVYM